MRILRLHLDGLAAPELDTPVVRIMVGDNNLDSQEARGALQRYTDDEALWEVFASPADRIGDNVAVSGAAARVLPVAVGASYKDRGMRNDQHDAFAVVLTLRGASQPAEAKTLRLSLEKAQTARSRCESPPENAQTPTTRCHVPSETAQTAHPRCRGAQTARPRCRGRAVLLCLRNRS